MSCDNDVRAGRSGGAVRSGPLVRDSCWRQSDMLEGRSADNTVSMSPVKNKYPHRTGGRGG